MKTILTVSLLAVGALGLASCAAPSNTNANTTAIANTNTNSAPKAPPAPTTDALLALDTKAFEAWKNKDGKYFEGYIADNFVGLENGKRIVKADVVKSISESKCDVKSYALSEPHLTMAGADAAVMTYKVDQDATCDGQKEPATVTAATAFVRSGDTWKGVYHNEVKVIETKAEPSAANSNKPPPPPPPTLNRNASSTANTAATSNTSSSAANTSTASNSGTSATAPAGGDAALTESLMAMEKKGWEAWKAKDASGFGDVSDKDFAFLDSTGKATFGKADNVRMWSTDNPCTVSSVNLSDGNASMITKDAAIVTYKGNAEGTCGAMKLGPLWVTSIFVKEGDAWKMVYLLEAPTGKM